MKLEFRPARLPERLLSPDMSAATERSSGREFLLRLGITLQPTRADLLNGRVRMWECAHDSQVVGRCAGDRRNGEIVFLDVHRGYEGLGIGAKLLFIVVGWLRAEGTRRLWLVAPCNPTLRAFGFYRALGWRPTGEFINDANEILELPADSDSRASH
jgi:ribosomal protein S18 acetylase RimI-like enzyme